MVFRFVPDAWDKDAHILFTGDDFMREKWAIAYERDIAVDGRFTWVRTAKGDIAVFERKTDAQKWVLARRDGINKKGEIVYIKISSE